MTACSCTTAWWVPGRIRLLYLQPLSWYRNSRDSHPGRHSFFYDPRNRGRSEAVSDTTHLGIQYSLSDLEDVRQHFRIKKMSLIGWSYLGAMVALYAAERPEQVDRVVQIGPIPPRKNPYWQQFLTLRAARME